MLSTEDLLIDRANLLTLTAPEMTVLVGSLRLLFGNHGGSRQGVLTDAPGSLSNDFFANLFGLGKEWKQASDDGEASEARYRRQAQVNRSRVDLVFGSNSELRAVAEVYARQDASETFVADRCRPCLL
jgi:catalase-peroxidase